MLCLTAVSDNIELAVEPGIAEQLESEQSLVLDK